MSPNGKLGPCLVLSFLLHSTGSSTGFGRKKYPAQKESQERLGSGWPGERPDRSLQTFWDLVELDNTGTAPGPMGRQGP